MAVNSITFGGVNSADYGIYIGGEGVFNAPARDVEMISIPGRNGAFALDNGRFENITVTYSAFNKEDDLATFSQKLDDFRNAICSQEGYQRLTDTFHPDEYRMATFIGGLEIKPIKYNTASEFNIVFECKPQRFLTSGETPLTTISGGRITNPTLFPSNPLLAIKGHGTLTLNGYEITLANVVLGNIELIPAGGANPFYFATYGTGLVNNGDTITVANECLITVTITAKSNTELIGEMVTNTGGVYSVNDMLSGDHITLWIRFPAETFTAGTSRTVSSSSTLMIEYREGGGLEEMETVTFTPSIEYTANDRKFKLSCNFSSTPYSASSINRLAEMKQVTANSTVSALGDPSYIDCEIGEAYMLVDGEVVSLNNAVSIGSALPELSPGYNDVSFPNTMTEVKVTPRWWKI